MLVNDVDFPRDLEDQQGRTPYDYALENNAPEGLLQLLQPAASES